MGSRFLGMGGSVRQNGSLEPGRRRKLAGELEKWSGREDKGWMGSVKGDESLCVSRAPAVQPWRWAPGNSLLTWLS